LGHDLNTGQLLVSISNGNNGFTNNVFGTLSTVVNWVNVITGDFNGDGKTDVAARVQQTGFWWVGINTGASFSLSKWGGQWPTSVNWVDVHVGDFTGDGKDDIVGRVQQTGAWWVETSLGNSFNSTRWGAWASSVTWVDVNVGDFDGDHRADVTGRVQQTGRWWVGLSTGNSFNSTPWGDPWSTAVTWVDVNVGDFNGDSLTDIAGRVLETGRWWVAVSNGSTAFTSSPWGAALPTTVTWVDFKVGDFNGDGKDIIVGRVLQTGRWWVGLSTGSNSFNFTPWDLWSTAVSWTDAIVGDFNGDGKDDIAEM